jgi:hypothetical protein
LNNRFVVPAGMVDNMTKFATLHDALTKPGLNAGDIVQIEPNSSPGQLLNADLPAVTNLTIQGDPAFDVQSSPFLSVGDVVTIGPAQQGFTLRNVQVDIQNGGFHFNVDGTIIGCRIKSESANGAIALDVTTAAVISNSFIENTNPLLSSSLVLVSPANGSHNRITDNQFVDMVAQEDTIVDYEFGTGTTDVLAHNTFIAGLDTFPLFLCQSGNQGLTVQGNTFTDDNPDGHAVELQTVQNLQMVDNVISLPNGANDSTGIFIFGDPTKIGSTSMVIANNHVSTGSQGTGIEFVGGIPGFTISAKVEDNDLQGNGTGILISKGQGGSVAGIDLGLGPLNGLGANDFRGDPTAISVSALAAAGPIGAFTNIFGVPDPTTVIHDQHNDPTLAAVVSSNPLTGNPAYVETLYLDFLHRTGNLSDPKDAGIWVTRLGQGMPATMVASDIARSLEGLGVAVDGLYHRFLGRDSDAAGRANFVAYLQNGGTLEGVSQMMLASPEYQSRFPTNSSFVQSLYQNLLHRTGSTAEVNAWVAQLPQLGRAGVAQKFLLSQEFRADEVSDDYTQLLHRTPSGAEVNSWVNTGKDLLTIDALFAASQEFQLNG